MAAERVALDKKRKAQGLPPLPPLFSDQAKGVENGSVGEQSAEDEERAKRRKILEEAAELDRDDSDEEDEPRTNGADKGKGKAAPTNGDEDEDEEEDDDDDDDDE